MSNAGPAVNLSTRAVAKLSGWPASRIRAYARAGLLEASRDEHGEYQYTFQDVVLLRAAKELSQARVRPRRVLDALRLLRAERGPLSRLKLIATGDALVASDGALAWEPASTQYCFEFAPAEPVAERDFPAHLAKAEADRWYAQAIELEESDIEGAIAAYARALELNPHHADAHNNTGRLLHARGRLLEATAHYRQALRCAPHVPAAYNLGLAYEQLGRITDAIEAFEKALRFNPAFVEAHAGLARLHERNGDTVSALRHLKASRELRAR